MDEGESGRRVNEKAKGVFNVDTVVKDCWIWYVALYLLSYMLDVTYLLRMYCLLRELRDAE